MLLFAITEMIENKDLNRKDYVFFRFRNALTGTETVD